MSKEQPGQSSKSKLDLARLPLLVPTVGLILGILIDHYFILPPAVCLLGFIFAIILYLHSKHSILLANYVLWMMFGSAYHHWLFWQIPATNLSHFLQTEPTLVRLRGKILEEPRRKLAEASAWISIPSTNTAQTILQCESIFVQQSWQSCTGKAWLQVDGMMQEIHIGDEIELFGWAARPDGPNNPGEFSFRDWLRLQQIHVYVQVRKSEEAIFRRQEGDGWSFRQWLTQLRRHFSQAIEDNLDATYQPLALALLLGETDFIPAEQWDQFSRTAVVHVIAISGQHLVMLTGIFWFFARLFGLSERKIAWLVAAFIVIYTGMTGARPAAVRAAVVILMYCSSIYLRRQLSMGNGLLASLFVVLLIQPLDLFHAGLHYSFLSMLVLVFVYPTWFYREKTKIERLIESSYSPIEKVFHWLVFTVMDCFRLTVVITFILIPFMLYHQQLMPLFSIWVGPLLIFLGVLALFFGFLMLALALLDAANWLGVIIELLLQLMQQLVHLADRTPYAAQYFPTPPIGWIVGFYGILFVLTVARRLGWPHRWLGIGSLFWCFSFIVWTLLPVRVPELQIHFLSVGHGSCAVMQTPAGRTFLFDIGSTSGPDITRRVIAPFLWSKGIRRIDEVFLSHADLDHFNGFLQLQERFAIGQVSWNPTFLDRDSMALQRLVSSLHQKGIASRSLVQGEILRSDELGLTVLHPKGAEPSGPENLRSLVLHVQISGHSLLFTGDIEKEGLDQLLNMPIPPVDVLQVPHHGSVSLPHALVLQWCQPLAAIVSRERGEWSSVVTEAYLQNNVPLWQTAKDGAVTVKVHRTGIIVQSFRSGQETVVKFGQKR